MADIPVQSCPLCLQADEITEMVPVELPHPQLGQPAHVVLCRPCSFAIADCVEGVPRTPAPEASVNE